MNSDQLVKDAYESILRNLPPDDADKVRAYVNDQLEIQRRVGQNRVERKNLVGLFFVILLGGSAISALSIFFWKLIELPDPVCEECEVCPPPPDPPKAVDWNRDSGKDWSWMKAEDKLCLYKERTLTCWYDDPLRVPPTQLPAGPLEEGE